MIVLCRQAVKSHRVTGMMSKQTPRKADVPILRALASSLAFACSKVSGVPAAAMTMRCATCFSVVSSAAEYNPQHSAADVEKAWRYLENIPQNRLSVAMARYPVGKEVNLLAKREWGNPNA